MRQWKHWIFALIILSLIATNNQDREALDKLIEQPIAWLGLLASRRKVQLFLRQLREKGVAEEHIARLHAPVGLQHRCGNAAGDRH